MFIMQVLKYHSSYEKLESVLARNCAMQPVVQVILVLKKVKKPLIWVK